MTLRIRRSVRELQNEYDAGNKKPLEDLLRAWKAIKELPPEHPKSFFALGGYHGAPFRGAGWSNKMYWGGYCQHGNVLFPTWHRAYLIKLEEALRSIPGCEEVVMPYWDETSEETLQRGIPWVLTAKDVELDGRKISNPLRSFVFSRNIVDHVSGANPNYSKHKGYETVRFPLSGLVGTIPDRQATLNHNRFYQDYKKNVDLLNQNVKDWLTGDVEIIVEDKKRLVDPVRERFARSLDAPNYTVFSNTTSAAEWNDNLPEGVTRPVVSLESPHNHIHLAIGGFDVKGVFSASSTIRGANGDMGEDDTAALDPIFHFHHCFIDRLFWLWQLKHNSTDHLEIIPEYPGTNSADYMGPTPGVVPNTWLTLDSPLDPFKKEDGSPYTSRDCINIKKQLGYTYSHGSSLNVTDESESNRGKTKLVRISGINRAAIRGSFLISVFAQKGDKEIHLGTEAVLSRWNVNNCANCQTHLEAKAHFEIDQDLIDKLSKNQGKLGETQGQERDSEIKIAVMIDDRTPAPESESDPEEALEKDTEKDTEKEPRKWLFNLGRLDPQNLEHEQKKRSGFRVEII